MNTESSGGRESAREIDFDPTKPHHFRPRDGDRRDGGGLFGGYEGPERRSGRDRRDQ